MLILEIVGLVIIFLSWLTVCWLIPRILEIKYYRMKRGSAYWYLWGLIGMGTGLLLILLS